MFNTKTATLLVLGLLTGGVHAHTRLQGSMPSDGATVSALREVVLEFSEEVHVTAVALRTALGDERTLGEVSQGPATSFTIPVEADLAPGEYVVTWRAVSADTHIVSGELTFTVDPA